MSVARGRKGPSGWWDQSMSARRMQCHRPSGSGCVFAWCKRTTNCRVIRPLRISGIGEVLESFLETPPAKRRTQLTENGDSPLPTTPREVTLDEGASNDGDHFGRRGT